MADTLPNIIVPAGVVADLYAESSIAVGTAISTIMIGDGEAKLYSGATLLVEPTDAAGFMPLYARETASNDSGDLGAFIWSRHGCTVNVKAV